MSTWSLRAGVVAAACISIVAIGHGQGHSQGQGQDADRGAGGEDGAMLERPHLEALRRLVDETQPPGDNGWPLVVEVLERSWAIHREVEDMTLDGERPRELDYDRLKAAAESDTRRELMALELLEERGVLDLLERAARSPRLVPPVGDEVFPFADHSLDLGASRALGRALQARCMRAVRDGDPRRIEIEVARLLGLRRILEHGTSPIEYLTAVAIVSGLVNRITRDAIDGPAPGPEACVALIAALEHGAAPSPAQVLRLERLRVLDVLDCLYTDDGAGDGALDLGAMEAIAEGRTPGALDTRGTRTDALGVYAGRREAVAAVDGWYTPAIAAAGGPVAMRARCIADAGEVMDLFGPRLKVVTVLFVAIDGILSAYDRHVLQIAALRTMLALELHRVGDDAYPESLGQLVPEAIDALPADPFSGEPLRYRRLDGPPAALPYILYSVGYDGQDNDARHDFATGAALQYPDFPVQVDHVVNLPGDSEEVREWFAAKWPWDRQPAIAEWVRVNVLGFDPAEAPDDSR